MNREIALASLLLCVSMAFGQPANDECTGALPLQLSMPGNCPAGAPAIDVFPGDNTGATPTSPYPEFAGCSGGTNDAPASEVWYFFDAEVRTVRISISGNLNTPNAILYRGDECEFLTPVTCGRGTPGSGTLTFIARVRPGNRYYLLVSGGSETDVGTFDMEITSFSDCDACQNINELTVSPPPVNGYYPEGELVRFCYTIGQWDLEEQEWLHAIEVDLGPGWDLTTLQPEVPPSCDGNGAWSWYPSWMSTATGNTYGPGFAYDSDNGGAQDGDPGNNWGDGADGCDSIGVTRPARTFCFSIRTLPLCTQNPVNDDLSVTVTVYSDGETGSWFQTGCNNRNQETFIAALNCCNDPEPQVLATNPATCREVCDGSVEFVGGGGGPWDYSIFDQNNNLVYEATAQTGANTATGLCSGIYSIVAVGDTCSRSTRVILGEGPPPDVQADNSGPFCRWGTIELLGSTTRPGSAINYNWTGPGGYVSNEQNPTDASLEGEYALIVEVDGCLSDPDTTRVSFLPDSLPAFPVPPQCASTDTALNLFGFLVDTISGVWREISAVPSQGGAFDAAAGTFNPLGQAPGRYVFAYAPQNGQPCNSNPGIVEVAVRAGPVANAGPDRGISCTANTAMIGSDSTSQGAGIRYEWSYLGGANVLFDRSSRITEVSQAGDYQLTVRDSLGCEAVDLVSVAPDTSLPVMTLLTQDVSCFGENDGSISVVEIDGGSGPYTLFLNGEDQGARRDFFNLAPGSYSLRVEDANGCFSETEIQVAEPEELIVRIVPDLADPFILQMGDSVTLEAQFNPGRALSALQWEENNNLIDSSSVVLTAGPERTSSYRVAIRDVNGCIAIGTITITVDDATPVFVPTAFSPNNDGNNDRFQPFAGPEVSTIRSFRVFNRWGDVVFEVQDVDPNAPALSWDGFFRGKPANPGVYIYHLVGERMDGSAVEAQGDVTLIR